MDIFEDYILQSGPVLFFEFDADGIIARVNRFTSDFLDLKVHESTIAAYIYNLQSVPLDSLSGLAKGPHNWMLRISENKTTPCSFCFYPRDQGGGYLVGLRDVDELERFARKLVVSNQELKALTRDYQTKNKQLEAINGKIIEITRLDPLTELANRRYFEERMKVMVTMAHGQSRNFSLIMADLDHFKKVNDAFGHDAGDRVLKLYAAVMLQNTRPEDLVARIGGEEFTMSLPFVGAEQAMGVAERVRRALAEKDTLGNGYPVTASFGVAQLKENEDMDGLIKRADTALLKAKRLGRNRVVSAEDG